MKNSIKTLTILLVTFLFSNVTKALNYTYNGSWTPTLNINNVSSSDKLIITSGTFTLSKNITVGSVVLSGGNLELGQYNINGRVIGAGTSNISSGLNAGNKAPGSINGALYTISGTTSLASSLAADTINFSGGTLNVSTYVLTANTNVNVLQNSTLSGSTGFIDGSGKTLKVDGGTLNISQAELVITSLNFASANNITTSNNGHLAFDTRTANTISNASASRHVNGTIRVYLSNVAQSSAAVYPLGNGSYYAPVSFQGDGKDSVNSTLSGGNSGTITPHYYDLTYVGSKHPVIYTDNTIVSASGSEYWRVRRSTTKPRANIGFYLNTTGTTYGQTAVGSTTNIVTDLELARFDPPSNKWTLVAAGVGSAINGGVPVISTGLISMNTDFTFASTTLRTNFLTPLPVSIIDFSAKANDASIEVKWSTASEKDNAAFVVEKSIDGQTWSAIGTVKGAKTSNVVNNYGLVDYKAVAGFQYYRLKQIDLDGTVNYSKAIAVNFSKASTLNVNLFPNPAKDALTITTENNATGEVNIQILNSMGETVYNQVVEAGLVQNIDIAAFNPGVYYISVIAEGESKIIRLLKN